MRTAKRVAVLESRRVEDKHSLFRVKSISK
jgi:hypothetical protein